MNFENFENIQSDNNFIVDILKIYILIERLLYERRRGICQLSVKYLSSEIYLV